MKTLLMTLLLLTGSVSAKDSAIKPLVAPAFGELFIAEVEFVDKGHSYIEQNIIKTPWSAKVHSVNGVALKKPIVMECRTAIVKVVKGRRYKLTAYEDFYSLGTPRGWTKMTEQITYMVLHRLWLRPTRIK